MSIKTYYEEEQIELIKDIQEKLHKIQRRLNELDIDIEELEEYTKKKLRKM